MFLLIVYNLHKIYSNVLYPSSLDENINLNGDIQCQNLHLLFSVENHMHRVQQNNNTNKITTNKLFHIISALELSTVYKQRHARKTFDYNI